MSTEPGNSTSMQNIPQSVLNQLSRSSVPGAGGWIVRRHRTQPIADVSRFEDALLNIQSRMPPEKSWCQQLGYSGSQLERNTMIRLVVLALVSTTVVGSYQAGAQDLPTGLGGEIASDGRFYSGRGAPRCVPRVIVQSGTSVAPFLRARERRAKRRARRNWTNYVSATYGPIYTNLDRATSVRYTCRGVVGRNLALNCSLSAIPCHF